MAPAADDGAGVPVCATCIRPGERVRGCRNGRFACPCSRCGWPTTGKLVGPVAPDPKAAVPSGVTAPAS
jgi:hypothetical protein